MKTKRRWPKATIEAALWIGVLGFLGFRMWPQLAAAAGLGSSGPQVANMRVESLAGDSIALADLRGKVVLVNFWATWCPPCRVEMPGFQKVYTKYRDQGFTIVGLSNDRGPRSVVTEFVQARSLTFPIAMANAEAVRAFGHPRALPTSYLIDRQGRIRYTVPGIFAQAALDRAVRELLAEVPPTGGVR